MPTEPGGSTYAHLPAPERTRNDASGVINIFPGNLYQHRKCEECRPKDQPVRTAPKRAKRQRQKPSSLALCFPPALHCRRPIWRRSHIRSHPISWLQMAAILPPGHLTTCTRWPLTGIAGAGHQLFGMHVCGTWRVVARSAGAQTRCLKRAQRGQRCGSGSPRTLQEMKAVQIKDFLRTRASDPAQRRSRRSGAGRQ